MQDLLKLARKAKIDALESAWTDAVADESIDTPTLLRVLEVLARHDNTPTAETLAWYLLDALRERGMPEQALEAARRAARTLPHSEVVRETLAELYAEMCGDREGIEELVRLTLRSSQLSTDEAVAALDNALALEPGSYVLDPQRGEVGRVGDFDAEEGALPVEFPDSDKSYGLALVGRLEPVEDDDFRALAAFERERLRQLAEEDPEELVGLVLEALDRRMELRRLRIYLEPILPSWSRWWSGARKTLERSSIIGMTPGRSPSLFLRREPLSHGERLLRKFRRTEDPAERLSMALHLLREARLHESPTAEEVAEAAGQTAQIARDAVAGDQPLALAATAVTAALNEHCPGETHAETPATPELSHAIGNPEQVAARLADPDLLKCILDYVMKAAPDRWQSFYASLMPVAPREVCSEAARRLAAHGDPGVLKAACEDLLSRPDPSAGALAWLWRQSTARQGDVPAEVDLVDLVVKILVAASSVVRSRELTEEERKESLSELRSALFARDAGPLRRALKQARPERLGTIKGLAEYNPGLTDHMRDTVLNALEKVKPELFTQEVPPWEEGVLYTTEAGLAKRRAELEHLVHERIPEVIREIGQAAEFGDLSENAEYSAAIEERGRLAERASRMEEEIAEARPITREVASADHVTVGSRVRVHNLDTDREQTLTFLGPWDADPRNGILAYNAPLGLAFMGKQEGDTVTYRAGAETRRWEILEVEPAV